MWRELIQECAAKAHSPLEELRFTTGASPEQLAEAEAALGLPLPDDLKTLLVESNGVRDSYGMGIIWSLTEIVQTNREVRTESVYLNSFMSFTDLLFFADAGNGDRFAFPIHGGGVQGERIFAWNHENDSRMLITYSLRSYLEQWLTGKIKL